MAESKTYLNVPFAEKDAAKALGARWDATVKKWYVPAVKDIALFAQWQTQSITLASPSTKASKPGSHVSTTKISSSANNFAAGVITQALDKNFIAYNGDEPPWS
ncbi:MAG: DUF5710 domain-containing protein [Methylococcaceae bacterium]